MPSLSRLLATYLRPYGGAVALVVGLLLIQSIANLYLPNLNADIINNGVVKGDIGYIWRIGAIMLALAVMVGILAIVAVWFSSGASMAFGRDVRRAVFERVGPFDQSFPVLSDRDFFGRFLLAGLRTVSIDRAVYRYGAHQQSLSFGSAAGQLSYNSEAIRLARTRLAQASTEPARAFYRRWLGWAIGYALARGLKDGSFAKASVTSAGKTDETSSLKLGSPTASSTGSPPSPKSC